MKKNLFTIVAIVLAIVATMLLGNLIVIGDKVGELTHVYVEYAFYILILILAIIYIVKPIIKLHRAPEFPVLATDDNWNTKQLYTFAMRLAKNCGYITDIEIRKKHQTELIETIKQNFENIEELKRIITSEITLRMDGSKEISVLGVNKRIKEWGKTVFMVTAISQNSKFDTIAVLVMNYKLVADIVIATGFRPTKPQLFKLYVRVLTTALITYCASQVLTDVNGVAPFDIADAPDAEFDGSDIDATDMGTDIDENGFGSGIIENIRKSSITSAIMGSAMEGCINALLTMRIGYVTRAYLTKGPKALSGVKNKRKIKRQAIMDSFKAMPAVIAGSGAVIGKSTTKWLTRIFKGEETE